MCIHRVVTPVVFGNYSQAGGAAGHGVMLAIEREFFHLLFYEFYFVFNDSINSSANIPFLLIKIPVLNHY